jgi:uncharacterized protein (UPF0276 family)
MTRRLDPVWISEHLSFNRIRRNGCVTDCGFLLPPAQTREAARVAARNIQRYGAALKRPVAFETGVNYLRPVESQLDDGRFFGAVAELADCGILLDVHNLWCNERNGRQRACDAVAQMPLDRVWELHFAGGEPLDGIWLDAHSGAMSTDLIEFTAQLMPQLPGVGALSRRCPSARSTRRERLLPRAPTRVSCLARAQPDVWRIRSAVNWAR